MAPLTLLYFVVVSQLYTTKYVFLHVVVLPTTFRTSDYAQIGKKGYIFQLCHQIFAVCLCPKLASYQRPITKPDIDCFIIP